MAKTVCYSGYCFEEKEETAHANKLFLASFTKTYLLILAAAVLLLAAIAGMDQTSVEYISSIINLP